MPFLKLPSIALGTIGLVMLMQALCGVNWALF